MNTTIKRHDVVIDKHYLSLPADQQSSHYMIVEGITQDGYLKLYSMEAPVFTNVSKPHSYVPVEEFPNPHRPGDIVHKMRYTGREFLPTQRIGKVTAIGPYYVQVDKLVFHYSHWEKHVTTPTNESLAGAVLTKERT